MLFDRICREQGITHRLTGIRCPTTTGKIERFHKTLRAELLTGRRFDSLAQAQQVLDDWIADYNFQRPHQAIAMLVPAQRFQPTADILLPVPQPRQPLTVGPTEITRRVSASGLIGVCYQQVSAGRNLVAKSSPCGCTSSVIVFGTNTGAIVPRSPRPQATGASGALLSSDDSGRA